jgi:MoaA/NifB/PqqE/SkfB family radical SAM enzyme
MFSSVLDLEFSPYKYLAHIDRLQAIAQGIKTPPVVLELDVCSSCDHSCAWCVDPPKTHSGQLMDVETAIKILEEARTSGIKGVVFKGGGECTLHPELNKIVQAAALSGFEVGIVTNGSHLHKNQVAESLIEHCAYIRISIDGPTREFRYEIHKKNDFEQLTTNIKDLVSLRKDKRHPLIGGTFCIDYSKIDHIGKCITLGEDLGLDYVLIRPPFCEEVGYYSIYTAFEKQELRSRMNEIAGKYTGDMIVMVGDWVGDKELEELHWDVSMSNELFRRDTAVRKIRYNGIEHVSHRCPACELYLVVTAAGNVYGCCCLRGIPFFSYGKIDYSQGVTLFSVLNSVQKEKSFNSMRSTECIQYCTHPLKKVNEIIEYLKLPDKFHSSFL